MLAPDAGEIRVLGHAMPKHQAAAKRDIGFVSDDMRLFAARDARLAHEFRRVHLPGLGRAVRRSTLVKRFNLRPEQNVQRPVRAASTSRRCCCWRSPAALAC